MSVRLAAFVPDMSAAVVFWGSLFLLGYVYLGYALLMCIRARLHPRSVAKAPFEPTVSVVVAAYNEASRIAARLENLLSLDYPRDRLEIIVGSDGSTDRTVEIAQRFAPAVNVRAYRKRRGKPAMINALVGEAHGRIVVFADARQRFDRGALRALVANFADRGVGAVGGELMLVDRTGAATSQGAGFYWRYEKFIRSMESRAGSTVGATGAIYAIRRDLFLPIAEDTILDDVVIPLRVACQGFRVTFEPEARAYDVAARSAREELTRKARTIAGTFQLLAREPWLLSPFRNPLWFETLSHKALRLTIPLLHASLLAANMALADQWFYKTVLIGQVAFYAAALAGGLQRNARRRWIALSVPYAMCLQGCATVVGFARCITGRQQVTWDRAAAPQPAESHP